MARRTVFLRKGGRILDTSESSYLALEQPADASAGALSGEGGCHVRVTYCRRSTTGEYHASHTVLVAEPAAGREGTLPPEKPSNPSRIMDAQQRKGRTPMTATGEPTTPRPPDNGTEQNRGETSSRETSFRETERKKHPAASRACERYSILDLCEQAHRDVTGQPLCLRDEDLRTAEIRQHVQGCRECARWYNNAKAAYERFPGDVIPVAPQPILPYEPRMRTSQQIVPAAQGTGFFLQRLKGFGSEGEGLDACELYLEWKRETRNSGKKGGERWWVTLRLQLLENDPTFGYDRAELERFNGYEVRLERWVPDRTEPDSIVTRMKFDAQQNLVSIPRPLDAIGPGETETIRLTLLERVDEVVGD